MDSFFGDADPFAVFETSGDKPAKKRKITEEVTVTQSKGYDFYWVNNEIEGCIHESIYPTGFTPKADFVTPDYDSVRKFAFTLDPFQRAAVDCVSKEESVLVAAHTSAGKTAIAEYAIATAFKNKQRIIYTSPIKALSNQKYRDLTQDFGEVGLMTGDVTIDENAPCLVMTTEILRSMLYRGSEVVREMAWVIFDEIHYMRDKERGVVWEETIIMLPPTVKLVFLSATIPNAREFAEWIVSLKAQPCHVVYTEMRPVPLQHYVYPSGGGGLYLVVNEHRTFLNNNFEQAVAELSSIETKNQRKSSNTDVIGVVKTIIKHKFEPAIVFSFSKRECEQYAKLIANFDLTDDREKQVIETVYRRAIETLSEEDQRMPMFDKTLEFLQQGIGIHHGGLLPIIKEVTEILFQEGTIKILFSTETFSMGLNMPARTVVFTNVRKFDGEAFRWIGGGEYIQMSGRAGRRGLDDKGIWMLIVDQKMEPEIAKSMLKGNADSLYSSFHLGYNMLLNLMRLEDANPEDMIRQSFHQFQNDKAFPEVRMKKEELEEQLSEFEGEDFAELQEIENIRKALEAYEETCRRVYQIPEYLCPFLNPGRLVRIIDPNGVDWGWGPVVGLNRKILAKKEITVNTRSKIQVYADVLLYVQGTETKPLGAYEDPTGEMALVPMKISCIVDCGSHRIRLPPDPKSLEGRKHVLSVMRELMSTFKSNPPALDPITDMNINDEEFITAYNRVKELREHENTIATRQREDFEELWSRYEQRSKLQKALALLTGQLKASQTMVLKDDWKAMKRVLRRLGYIGEGVIELKGRIAAEISTSDELLATELMLNGTFKDLPIDIMLGLLSCLVYQDSGKAVEPTNEDLVQAYDLLKTTAERIGTVSQEAGLDINIDDYIGNYKPTVMEAVVCWANGGTFEEANALTDAYEGSLIRGIRRLHELLRQLKDAAKTVQSTELYAKFDEGIQKIERGIIFAASLYL